MINELSGLPTVLSLIEDKGVLTVRQQIGAAEYPDLKITHFNNDFLCEDFQRKRDDAQSRCRVVSVRQPGN